MKGCRTAEDIKRSSRDYFRKQREKQRQKRNPKTFNQVWKQPQPHQSQPDQTQTTPTQIIYTQPQQSVPQQPIIIQQPAPQQQQPIIIQPQVPQQPAYQVATAQQPQPLPRQRRKSGLSRFVIAVLLVGVLITGIWMYQGGLDLALQNWTSIFYEIKNLAQRMIGLVG